jgi:SAM-dependent methyltransferase
MTTPDEIKSFDRVAHLYDDTRAMPPHAQRAIAAAIASVLTGAPPRLLEVGIGTGRIAVPLSKAGVRVTGIDVAPMMLARLREKRADIDVALAEAAHPPFRPASFDGALFVHILHLVPDAVATLRATVPLVRPAGVLILGAEDRSPGHRDEADRIIDGVVRELTGARASSWPGHDNARNAFTQVVAEASARVERIEPARWQRTSTARRMVDRLANRTYSSSWRIPNDALPEVVRRATPLLVEAYGGLDREVAVDVTFSLTVAHLP